MLPARNAAPLASQLQLRRLPQLQPAGVKKFTTKRNAQQSPRDQTDTCATDEMSVDI
jgi:hypothetical protein